MRRIVCTVMSKKSRRNKFLTIISHRSILFNMLQHLPDEALCMHVAFFLPVPIAIDSICWMNYKQTRWRHTPV